MAKKTKKPTSPSDAAAIRAQIKKLEAELKALGGSTSTKASTQRKDTKKGGRRVVSEESKAKMAAAQTARWAKVKKSKPAASKPVKKARRTMSPEARAKIAEAQRKRWAKARKK